MKDKTLPVPVFRRSLFGYSARDVDRFLNETAADRDRLRDTLSRVESLMAQWQCASSADAIRPVAHDAAKTRAQAESDATTVPKPAESRLQPVLPRWEAPATSEPSVPAFGNGRSFVSGGFNSDNDVPLPEHVSVTREPVTAIKALELSRSNRRRQRRRIAGLVAACAVIAAIITFEFRTQRLTASYGTTNAQAAVATTRLPTAKAPDRSGSTAAMTTQMATEAKASSGKAPETLTLTISAIKTCWIRTVVDGSQPMERTLKPDETVMLHATNEVLLRVGDAAALSMLINNRPAKALGGSGEVITRRITRANYASLVRNDF
jgi:hypothetical protein